MQPVVKFKPGTSTEECRGFIEGKRYCLKSPKKVGYIEGEQFAYPCCGDEECRSVVREKILDSYWRMKEEKGRTQPNTHVLEFIRNAGHAVSVTVRLSKHP